MQKVSIVECPRDAWQGMRNFIPTNEKVKHIVRLLKCGFDTIDAGSFVSPKAMPQMADAKILFEALEQNRSNSPTKLLAIVANEKGARRASEFGFIDSWGYPFSVSEQFQLRNSRKTISQSMDDLKRVKDLAIQNNTELVVYLSMAFGNPYGERYSEELVLERMEEAILCGADVISISDTTGEGASDDVSNMCLQMNKLCPLPWGVHLHCTYDDSFQKAQAALQAGCVRIDTALKGFGGCPYAADELVGNMPTEKVVTAIESLGYAHDLHAIHLESAYNSALNVFQGQY